MNLPAKSIKPFWALFEEPKNMPQENIAVLPAEWVDSEVASSGFAPTAIFDRPGAAVTGAFSGMHTGPNGPVWELTMHDGNRVNVWGATILDDRIRRLNPSPGDLLLIIFVGTLPTKRGLSPAKNFEVRLKRKGAAKPITAPEVPF